MDAAPTETIADRSESPYSYRRIVSKLNSQVYRYLKVHIKGHRYGNLNISQKELKHAINMSMKSVFGLVGGATTVDLLKYDPKSNVALIRCRASFYVKVRSCLTFLTAIAGRDDISVHVLQSSSHLMALAGNSRELLTSLNHN